jgi:hypothetical protein
MIKRSSFSSKYVSVHTNNIETEADLAGGQILLEEQTSSIEIYIAYRASREGVRSLVNPFGLCRRCK